MPLAHARPVIEAVHDRLIDCWQRRSPKIEEAERREGFALKLYPEGLYALEQSQTGNSVVVIAKQPHQTTYHATAQDVNRQWSIYPEGSLPEPIAAEEAVFLWKQP